MLKYLSEGVSQYIGIDDILDNRVSLQLPTYVVRV